MITAYFPMNRTTAYLLTFCIDVGLQLIPVWVVVFMISEMLFTYRNPGRNRLVISRVFLVLALFVFLTLGIILTFSDVEAAYAGAGDAMMFWHGMVCIFSTAFTVMPSVRLIQAISWPVLQTEDAGCVRSGTAIVIGCVAINGGRGIWDVTAYFGWNVLSEKISSLVLQAPDGVHLPAVVRIYYFVWELLVNAVYTGFITWGVLVLRMHEKAFGDDPFYRDDEHSERY
jgi:hypothetical protein